MAKSKATAVAAPDMGYGTRPDGEPTENNKPVAAVPDVSNELAPWVTSGMVGVITATRAGVRTIVNADLMKAAENIAHLVVGAEHWSEVDVAAVIGPEWSATHELRIYDGPTIPTPGDVLPKSASGNPWPVILMSPVHAEIGVGYATDGVTNVIVVLARRAILPRAKRKAS